MDYFTFKTVATGEQEVPVVHTDTTSLLEIAGDSGFTLLEHELSVNKGVKIDRAHLHYGRAGVAAELLIESYDIPAGTTLDSGGVLSRGIKSSVISPIQKKINALSITSASISAAMKRG